MYLEFFGLREKPFNVTPDPHFLYMSPSHQEAFANLLYGVRERKGFIMMTGEVGTGKTTLLHNLLANIDDDIQTVFVFHTGIEFTDLLEMIHHELGIPVSTITRAALLQSLNRYLIEQLEQGKNVALIIDEAQNLSPEILENLRQLSNLETAKDKLLQIVLVGQPELDEKMSLAQLRQLKQRVTVQGLISTLSPSESRAYILHRLGVAGAPQQGRHLFSEEALALIVHSAGGVPRQLNVLCDNAFLIAFAGDCRKVESSHAREAIRDHGTPTPSASRRSAKAVMTDEKSKGGRRPRRVFGFISGVAILAAVALLVLGAYHLGSRNPEVASSPSSTGAGVDPARPAAETPEPSSDTDQALMHEADGTPEPRNTREETLAPENVSSPEETPAPEPVSTSEQAVDEVVVVPPQERSPAVDPEPEVIQARSVQEPTPIAAAQSQPSRQTPDIPLGVPAEYTANSSGSVDTRPPLDRGDGNGGSSRLDFWRASSIRELQRILDQKPRVTYTVQPGEHFLGLVHKATGRRDLMVVDLLERMNPHISDYNHIEPGWVLYLPDFDSDVDMGSAER